MIPQVIQAIESISVLTPQHVRAIEYLHMAQQNLECATTPQEIKQVVSDLAILKKMAKEWRLELQHVNVIAAKELEAERKLGKVLNETPTAQGHRGNDPTPQQALMDELGIPSRTVWAQLVWLGALDEQELAAYIAKRLDDVDMISRYNAWRFFQHLEHGERAETEKLCPKCGYKWK